jgi:hypothetical protein
MLTTINLASFDRSHHYHRRLIKCPSRQRLLPGVRVMQTIFEIKCCLVHDTRLSEQPANWMLGPAEHMNTNTTCTMQPRHVEMSTNTKKLCCEPCMKEHCQQAHVQSIVCRNRLLSTVQQTGTHTYTVTLDIIDKLSRMHK